MTLIWPQVFLNLFFRHWMKSYQHWLITISWWLSNLSTPFLDVPTNVDHWIRNQQISLNSLGMTPSPGVEVNLSRCSLCACATSSIMLTNIYERTISSLSWWRHTEARLAVESFTIWPRKIWSAATNPSCLLLRYPKSPPKSYQGTPWTGEGVSTGQTESFPTNSCG